MDLFTLLAEASDPLQHWSLVVSIAGGTLLVISLLWKGVPALWKAVRAVRTKHQEALTRRIVAAVEPMFAASTQHLDDHMKREELEIAERNRQTAKRDRTVTAHLSRLDRGMSGIAGALGVDLRQFDSTTPTTEHEKS